MQLQRRIDLSADVPKAIDEAGRNLAGESNRERDGIDVSRRGGMINRRLALPGEVERKTWKVCRVSLRRYGPSR